MVIFSLTASNTMRMPTRLNNVIRALENGQVPIATWLPPSIDGAVAIATAPYDGVVFEAEHNPYDIATLKHCLQYMLNRKQIVDGASLTASVTPIVRIP